MWASEAMAAPVARRRAARLPAVTAAAAALLVATAAAWAATATTGGGVPVDVGAARAAPAFALPALRAPGSVVSLTAVGGHPVVLSFFASWCSGCQQELAAMARSVASAPRDVAVVGIDVNDTAGAARGLLAADRLAIPVGVDARGGVAATYGLVGLPTTVFLDARHDVIGRVVGPLTPAAAATWLRRLG